MFRSFFKSLPFGPLAVALLLAALATPFARDAGQGLRSLTERHGELIAGLRPTFGVDLSALGPYIEFPDVPLRKADGTLQGSDLPLRLYPAELGIEIDATTQVVERDGFRVNWMLGDIRLTARFAEPPGWSGYFAPGGRPDWSGAILRLPYPAPQSLADHPEIILEGQPWRMDQNWGAHNRLTLERPVDSLPQGDVVITYRRTAVGPDIVIGADGVRSQVHLTTDFPLTRRSGPKPQEARSTSSGSDWRWALDTSATFDGVINSAEDAEPDQNQAFLGMSFREPDETGEIALHSALTQPVFADISGLVQFIPMAYAAAALMAFICRAKGFWPQLGLAVVGLISLATSFYVAQRLDDTTGWSAGAVAAAIGAGVVLLRQGRRTAMAVALAFAGAWVALLLVPSRIDPSGPLPLSIVVLRLSQPAAFLLGLLAALIALVRASVRSFARRRAAT